MTGVQLYQAAAVAEIENEWTAIIHGSVTIIVLAVVPHLRQLRKAACRSAEFGGRQGGAQIRERQRFGGRRQSSLDSLDEYDSGPPHAVHRHLRRDARIHFKECGNSGFSQLAPWSAERKAWPRRPYAISVPERAASRPKKLPL